MGAGGPRAKYQNITAAVSILLERLFLNKTKNIAFENRITRHQSTHTKKDTNPQHNHYNRNRCTLSDLLPIAF